MTFTSPVQRVDAPLVADEREALSAWLDYQRATVLMKCEGLDDEQLRRSLVPSGTNLIGLVKHLAEVEHWWFARHVAQSGEPQLYYTDEDPDADMRAAEGETTDEIVSAYLRALRAQRAIYRDAPSLDVKVQHERHGEIDLRWVMLHMIEETARHNGHADIIREQIDGATGE